MPGAAIYHWDELLAESAAGVIRRGIQGQGASVKQIEIPAGSTAGRHSHDHEQFVIVLKGSGRLECEVGSVMLKPGTVIHFAPHAWHSAVFDTPTVLMEVNLTP